MERQHASKLSLRAKPITFLNAAKPSVVPEHFRRTAPKRRRINSALTTAMVALPATTRIGGWDRHAASGHRGIRRERRRRDFRELQRGHARLLGRLRPGPGSPRLVRK